MANRMKHETPGWVDSGAVYFITVTAKRRGENQFCQPVLGPILLDSIRWRQGGKIWHCWLAVIMPDHIHLLLGFPPERTMTKVIRDWKNWLGRIHGVQWQDGFFDHRLRREESLAEKADYMLQNPVRAGLVAKAEDWIYFWRDEG